MTAEHSGRSAAAWEGETSYAGDTSAVDHWYRLHAESDVSQPLAGLHKCRAYVAADVTNTPLQRTSCIINHARCRLNLRVTYRAALHIGLWQACMLELAPFRRLTMLYLLAIVLTIDGCCVVIHTFRRRAYGRGGNARDVPSLFG